MQPNYLHPLADILALKTIAPQAWLGDSMTGALSGGGAEQNLSVDEYRVAVIAAIDIANDPLLGAKLGQKLALHHHGTLGLALMNCETLSQAFKFIARYLPIRTPFLQAEFVRGTKKGVLNFDCIESHKELADLVLQTTLFSIAKGIEQLVPDSASGGLIRIDEENFQRLRTQILPQMWQITTCDRGLSFEVPIATLDRRLPQSEPTTRLQAEKLCEQQLSDAALDHSSTQNIVRRYLLAQQGQHEGWTLAEAANAMNMTPRTMHRRLAKEGLKFQTLLDTTRQACARELLASGRKVEQVALELGYQDVANFRRAFRRWFGMSPLTFKQSKEIHES